MSCCFSHLFFSLSHQVFIFIFLTLIVYGCTLLTKFSVLVFNCNSLGWVGWKRWAEILSKLVCRLADFNGCENKRKNTRGRMRACRLLVFEKNVEEKKFGD